MMMISHELPHRLDRTIEILADPATVFRFFTDPVRWAAWWGTGSTIDPRVGGRVLIRYPDGTEASGEILEIDVPARLAFTYGYVKGTPIPPGSSRVTIELEAKGRATMLHLAHAFADPGVRDEHVQGWRYQLSLFANAVANEHFAGASRLVDRWFAAWAETDPTALESAIAALASPGIGFHDRFSTILGVPDLVAHIRAAQHFMPGFRLERTGDVRHCQGMVIANWSASTTGKMPPASGTNIFRLDADGRIGSVTGFWTT